MDEEQKSEVANRLWSIWKRNVKWMGIRLYILTTMILGTGWLHAFSKSNSEWFQRSGSLAVAVVIFGIAGAQVLSERNIGELQLGKAPDYSRPKLTELPVAAAICLAVATIVWGYGDLFMDWVIGWE